MEWDDERELSEERGIIGFLETRHAFSADNFVPENLRLFLLEKEDFTALLQALRKTSFFFFPVIQNSSKGNLRRYI